MLLHEHPVNLAREASARVPVNSVWTWGGGRRPASGSVKVATYASDGIATALAAHVGAPAQARPSALAAVLSDAPRGATTVIVFDRGADPAALERDWTSPAARALAGGGIGALRVLADGPDGAFAWSIPRPTLAQRLGFGSAPELSNVLAAARSAIDNDR